MGIFGSRRTRGAQAAGKPQPMPGRRPEEFVGVFAGGTAPARKESLLVPKWGEAEWTELLAQTEVLVARAGDIVIERGERDQNLYFIAAGRVEVTAPSPDAMSISPLVRLGEGSVIGELAFFDHGGRSASVWAVSDCVLLRLTEATFWTIGEQNPALARDLLYGLGRVLATRLRRATSRRSR